MYLSYYNLKTNPFLMTCDPRFLWLGERHKQALSILHHGIKDNQGFLLLTGDSGTGKTLLVHRLITMLPKDALVATLLDPDLTSIEFNRVLADAYNVSAPVENKAEFLIQLRDFLQMSADNQRQALLIIDEAQRLNRELMEDIRVLSIEFYDQKLINILFVGQPEFNHVLMQDQNNALSQRITTRYQIEPLNQEETGSFIQHRLHLAGSTLKLINEGAVQMVHRYSGGIPGLINNICDNALRLGSVHKKKEVDADVITECARKLHIPTWRGSAATHRSDSGVPQKTANTASAQTVKKLEHSHPMGKLTNRNADRSRKQPRSTKWLYSAIASGIFIFLLFSLFNLGGLFSKPNPEHEVNTDKAQGTFEEMISKPAQRVAEPAPIIKISARTVSPPSTKPKQQLVQGRHLSTAGSTEVSIKPVLPIPVQRHHLEEAGPAALSSEQMWPKKENVFIQFDESNWIEPKSLPAIDQVASFLSEFPERVIYLHGPPNQSGSPKQGGTDWRMRTNIVKHYLIGKGVYSHQIKVFVMAAHRLNTSLEEQSHSGVIIEFPQEPILTDYNPDK